MRDTETGSRTGPRPAVLTDQQIAALSPAERRALIHRLAQPLDAVLPRERAEALRRRRIALMVAAVVVLVPWTAFLALTLPPHYEAADWSTTWVGFDLLLIASFAATAMLGWQRRQLVVLTAFATGLLLVCDSWFDVMTAAGDDRWLSLASALLVQLPLAVLLLRGSLRLLRASAERFWELAPGEPLLSVRLLLAEPAGLSRQAGAAGPAETR